MGATGATGDAGLGVLFPLRYDGGRILPARLGIYGVIVAGSVTGNVTGGRGSWEVVGRAAMEFGVRETWPGGFVGS